jgi:soluble lytic murein transglycosylase-like protein
MVFRKVAAGLIGLSAMSLVAGTSFAESTGTARDAALQSLKSQLRSGSDGAAGVADASRWGEIRAAAVRLPAPRDPVSDRLESVFDMLPPEGSSAAVGAPATVPRLPVPRPEAASEADALAYAAGPARTNRGANTSGLSAIEELVEQHAEANDVPPALAQALVQVESSHNPKAKGRNGEIGLLQIKPKTARAMGLQGLGTGPL